RARPPRDPLGGEAPRRPPVRALRPLRRAVLRPERGVASRLPGPTARRRAVTLSASAPRHPRPSLLLLLGEVPAVHHAEGELLLIEAAVEDRHHGPRLGLVASVEHGDAQV